ncbi:hypothetical protein SGM_3077 [Streptomyces griseoaurantiacus M045]|uniref:Uncharacterized protein n=1 Tax=Streptomyces griseoaurantiacus M045 TaxID=996637 RepID=F3NJE3_9ACTN|nr:hypothetical protein SGM_3077 [Streptomyces griseoaurantiacus M045]
MTNLSAGAPVPGGPSAAVPPAGHRDATSAPSPLVTARRARKGRRTGNCRNGSAH